MDFKRGIKDGIPICLGYFSVSVAFGVTAVQGGLTWLEAVMISLFNLTSAGQKAGLDVIVKSGPLIEIALTQLLINARYALMGISLSQKLEKDFASPYRALLGFAITDEIFAVASGNKEEASAAYRLAVKKVDQAVSHGILHKNTAARKKSALTVKFNTIA